LSTVNRTYVCIAIVGRPCAFAERRLLSDSKIQRRSLKMELLPPNKGYELPTTSIRGK